VTLSASASAALVVLAILGASGARAPATAVLPALTAAPTSAPIASERIYFVMTDRYANGDPSNDRGGLVGDALDTGFDPGDPGFFHGGDFKGLTGDCTDPVHGLARIKALGFNAIWVTPPFGQGPVQNGSAAYHGYWIENFEHVDPHFGTDADFGAFVDCAHRLGLKVILDVVVNHTADVIKLPGATYNPQPYRDCHGKVFDPTRYVTAKTFPCMTKSGMPWFPTVPSGKEHAKSPDWLNDPLNYHNRGNIDFSSCSEMCFEQGDFYGLDDLFTEKPAVMNGLAQIYAGWISRYKIDGFRIDTAKHVNAAFFRLWAPKILAAARAAGVPDFQMFGEVTLTDAVQLSAFVRDRGLPNVLDFPFQDAAASYAGGGSSAKALANRLADDDYFRLADGIDPAPPTFLGNHDMGRAARMIEDAGHATGVELLQRVLLGYDLLYLLRGAPVVYYGDEVGMLGAGGDKAAREDMFPTQVPEWRTEQRVGSPPIGGGSSFDVTANPIELRLKELAALREANPALATGATIVRVAKGAILAVSRIDAAAKREYVAVFNDGTSAARVTVPTSTPSSTWTALLGTAPQGKGTPTVDVPPLGTMLLRADADLPVAAPAAPTLRLGPDDLSTLLRLTATVKGLSPVSVTFGVRRARGGWQRIAVDDTPPYRAFVEPGAFRKKEKVSFIAVVRSLDGRTAVSKVVKGEPR
jgi:glycosidase